MFNSLFKNFYFNNFNDTEHDFKVINFWFGLSVASQGNKPQETRSSSPDQLIDVRFPPDYKFTSNGIIHITLL